LTFNAWAFVAVMIFNAGGLLVAFRQLTKDVNGIGRKVNQMAEKQSQAELENEKRRHRLIIALLSLSTEEHRREVLRLLLEK